MSMSRSNSSGLGLTQILLLCNLAVLSFLAWTLSNSAQWSVQSLIDADAASFVPTREEEGTAPRHADHANDANDVRTNHDGEETSGDGGGKRAPPAPGPPTDGGIGSVDAAGVYFVRPREGERDFYAIGKTTRTDKVTAPRDLPRCLKDDAACTRPNCTRPECRPWGHHYDTIYQQRLGPYSRDDAEPFQFLEIGFFNGRGYDTYREFFPRGECHSMEIACIEPGPREEGKWPWGNFAEKNPRYQQYLDENRLHCGDASDVNFLHSVWTEEMRRPDAPPLKIVVDDGAHVADQMAQTVFFWFPRIAPRGILVVEDVQPISEANHFRTQFLPQIMKDLHFCGDPKQASDDLCFPSLFPLLASIHCEMHICIFERSDHPAREPTVEESRLPANALDMSLCRSELNGHW